MAEFEEISDDPDFNSKNWVHTHTPTNLLRASGIRATRPDFSGLPPASAVPAPAAAAGAEVPADAGAGFFPPWIQGALDFPKSRI